MEKLNDIFLKYLDVDSLGLTRFQFYPEDNFQVLIFKRDDEALLKISYYFMKPTTKTYMSNIVRSGVSLNSVESIMMDFSKGYSRDEVTVVKMPNVVQKANMLKHISEIVLIENGIVNYGNLEVVALKLREYIKQFSFPLLDSVKSVEQVNRDLVAVTPTSDLSDYMFDYPYRKAIILKLAKDSGFEAFDESHQLMLIENIRANPNDKWYIDAYNNYMPLSKYLRNGFSLTQEERQALVWSEPTPKVPVPQPISYKTQQLVTVGREKLSRAGIELNEKVSTHELVNDANWIGWDMSNLEGDEFVDYLLLLAGTMIKLDDRKGYQPASLQLINFNAEWDGEVSYSGLIYKLNRLTGVKLEFTNILQLQGTSKGVSFRYKNQEKYWEFEDLGDWTDMDFFVRFIALVRPDLEKEYYVNELSQGGLIFYFSKEERVKFETVFPNRKLITLLEFGMNR